MRLVKCKLVPTSTNPLVICYRCARAVAFSEMWADLDGPAFQAYYCAACKPQPETQEEKATCDTE